MNFTPGFQSEGVFKPDLLVGGDHPIRTIGVTIVTGQNLKRGALLGKITTGGKYTLSLSASTDGSQTPVAILLEDTDATAADVIAPVYVAGDFNANQMTIGTGHTVDSVRDALHGRSIYLHTAVPA